MSGRMVHGHPFHAGTRQLALDGAGEWGEGSLFGPDPVDDLSTVDEVTGARVFSIDGRELCPACATELRRGECKRCARIGATAPALELEGER